jgi:hypothetical protein
VYPRRRAVFTRALMGKAYAAEVGSARLTPERCSRRGRRGATDLSISDGPREDRSGDKLGYGYDFVPQLESVAANPLAPTNQVGSSRRALPHARLEPFQASGSTFVASPIEMILNRPT